MQTKERHNTVAFAPAVKCSDFIRKFRLFLGQCEAALGLFLGQCEAALGLFLGQWEAALGLF